MVLPDLGPEGPELTFIAHWLTSCGLTVEDVQKHDRRPRMVQARREIAHYLRGHHWSTPAIGRFLGRDHTTVLHLLGRA